LIISDTPIPGVKILDIEPASDDRGFFARTFDAALLAPYGIPPAYGQCSISYNLQRGTLRGLHFQAEPHGEAKLIRCTRGGLFDVAVDLRVGSPAFGRWTAIELSAENRRTLFIPSGCAHGFLTLEDDTEVFYQIAGEYIPQASRGVRWDDPDLAISWPGDVRIISERDAALPPFSDFRPGLSAD
jgi:dTDP-4-dehydrorhamnose 3,5-epimerase